MRTAPFRTYIHLNSRHPSMPRIISAALKASRSPLTVNEFVDNGNGNGYVLIGAPSRAGIIIHLADLRDVPLMQLADVIIGRVDAALSAVNLAA